MYKTMFRKLVIAFGAVAALGTAALSSTDASAREWKSVGVLGGGGGGWHGGHGGYGGGYGHRGWGGGRHYGYGRPAYYGAYGSCTVRRLVATPYGYRYRLVNRC